MRPANVAILTGAGFSALLACAPAPAAQASPERHTLDVDGHPISVLEKRARNPAAAILLIHGRTWSGGPDFDIQVEGENLSLMDRLVTQGYAVYAQDLRGYGHTPRDSTGWLTPRRAAADVAAVLRWIADSSGVAGVPALFGWSYGSMVSMLTAQEHPDLVSALVLYGFPLNVDTEIPAAEPTGPPRRTPTTDQGARSDFITPGSISDLAVNAFVRAALAADPVRTDWRNIYEFNALDPGRVMTRTLFIHGVRDPLVNVGAAGSLFGRLATEDRQWTMVPGGDHAAHLERPETFVSALVEWLGRGTGAENADPGA